MDLMNLFFQNTSQKKVQFAQTQDESSISDR